MSRSLTKELCISTPSLQPLLLAAAAAHLLSCWRDVKHIGESCLVPSESIPGQPNPRLPPAGHGHLRRSSANQLSLAQTSGVSITQLPTAPQGITNACHFYSLNFEMLHCATFVAIDNCFNHQLKLRDTFALNTVGYLELFFLNQKT